MDAITTTPGTIHQVTPAAKTYYMGEVNVGRRTFQGFQRIGAGRMTVSMYLLGSDGSEWDLVYRSPAKGQGIYRGHQIAVNRETDKKLMKQGKIARFDINSARMYFAV